jgi:uncharacterized damage-inducible protein DinB
MDANYVRTLFEYERWANARVLAAVERLNQEQFMRDMRNSMPSVRDTMVHILSAQRTWLSRWNGVSPTRMLEPAKFPDMKALSAAWRLLEAELVVWLGSLTDERLKSQLAYTTLSGQPQSHPLWQQLAHLVNHSSYHRGQITTMLRQLGADPVNTDLITFFREQAQPAS